MPEDSDFDIIEWSEIEMMDDFFSVPNKLRQTKTLHELKELFDDEDYITINKYISFITASFVLITTVSSFFLSVNAYIVMKDNTDEIKDLFDNWQTEYITDIVTVKNENTCPEGFEPMINRYWQGTYEGGYGPKSKTSKSKLHHGRCSESNLNNNGTHIDPIPKMSLSKFDGRVICIKRSNNNFLIASRPDLNGECPNFEYKNGNPDSHTSRAIGVKSHDECPITDIIITKNTTKEQYTNYTEVPLESNMTLLYSRTYNHLPVVQFKLTEGIPGIAEDEFEFTPNRLFYKLIKRDNLLGCHTIMNSNITYDYRYRLIASQDEYSLLEDNGILPLLKRTSNYVGDMYSRDYFYNLYQKSYVRWKIEGEKQLSRRGIYEKAKNVEIAWHWQSIFSVIGLFGLVITGFIFGIVNWIHSFYRLGIPKDTRSKIGKLWDRATNGVAIIFAFMKIIMIFIGVYIIDKYEYSIRIVQLNEGSDDVTNQSFRIVGESLIQSRFDNLFALKLTMLMLTFEAINYLTPIIVDLRKTQSNLKNNST